MKVLRVSRGRAEGSLPTAAPSGMASKLYIHPVYTVAPAMHQGSVQTFRAPTRMESFSKPAKGGTPMGAPDCLVRLNS